MTDRYSRQILFAPIGEEGQRKLREKHVLIIGAGALGSSSAEMLVRAGIGKLTIVDRDYIDWSNLQRQQLYCEQDVQNQLPKAVAAKTRLEAINSDVHIHAYVEDAATEELEKLVQDADVVIDATDNFETRFMINDAAQKHHTPWVYGACVGSYGLSYTIIPGKTPCLSCLLKVVPLGGATCDTAGIISPAVSMVVSHQVAEVMKLLVGDEAALRGKLVSFDVWNNEYSSMNVQSMKRSDCSSCGIHASYPYLQQENISKTTVLCGRNTVQIRIPQQEPVDLEHYKSMLEGKVDHLLCNPYLLSFTLGDKRLVLFRDGRVLVHGTNDSVEAKVIYHRYFG